MASTAAIVICSIAAFQSLLILTANTFTVHVYIFWSHRNKLKRTSFLLINLAVADLLIGFTEPVAIGTVGIPWAFWPRILRECFNRISSNVRCHFCRLPRSHFLGTSVCIDLPISTSSDKHSSLHLQYNFCVVFRNNCGCIHFARCKWNSGFYPLDSSLLLYFSFMFADRLYVLLIW